MSLLHDYLNTHFTSPTRLDELVPHFREKFGVVVKSEGDLCQFKYHQLDSNWQEPLTHECRGTIVEFDREAQTWTIRSRPYDKFFNQHQGRCPVFEEKELLRLLPECFLHEKADGTCIQLWFDRNVNRWRASTLGTITPSTVAEETFTFDELFFRTSGISPTCSTHSPNITYIYELCCEENRIVTKYDTDQVVLLGARVNASGKHCSSLDLRPITDRYPGVRRARSLPAMFDGMSSLADLKAYVETSSTEDTPGEQYTEGFVLYHYFGDMGPTPIAKFKNLRYLALHHTSGADVGHSKNMLVDAVFLGHLDDIYGSLTPRLAAFADKVTELAKQYVGTAQFMHLHLSTEVDKGSLAANRKSLALEIQQDHLPSFLRGFFFRNIPIYLDSDTAESFDFETAFSLWLRDNYKKFEWKKAVEEAS